MDSTAYRYQLERLRPIARNFAWVPPRFAEEEPTTDSHAFETLAQFLSTLPFDALKRTNTPSDITGEKGGAIPLYLPMHRLIYSVVEAIGRSISPAAPSPLSGDRRRGVELFRMLVQAAHPQRMNLFDSGNSAAAAMACFLIEACMHLGWCPNGKERHGKRAAHLYFVHSRKSTSTASSADCAAVFCFLWAAWLLAQRTEGIREDFVPSERNDTLERYDWDDGERTVGCLVFNRAPKSLYTVVPFHDSLLPSACSSLTFEGHTGSSSKIDGLPLAPQRILTFELINRPKISGGRWDFSCVTEAGVEAMWTTVIQLYGCTFYRIDLLKVSAPEVHLASFQTRIEVGPQATPITDAVFRCATGEMTTVELIVNPFEIQCVEIAAPGVASLSGGSPRPSTNTPFETTTAWRRGPDVSAIERTHLLGIFDLQEPH